MKNIAILSIVLPVLASTSLAQVPTVKNPIAFWNAQNPQDFGGVDDQQAEEAIVLLGAQADGAVSIQDVAPLVGILQGWCEGPELEFSGACRTRQFLRTAIQDFAERAEAGFYTRADVLSLEVATVDAKLDRAIAWLQGHAVERGATREQYDHVLLQLELRAELVMPGNGLAESMRTRWIELMDSVRTRAITATRALQQFQFELVRDRYQRAVGRLILHARARAATRAQYAHVQGLWSQRARHAVSDFPLSCN